MPSSQVGQCEEQKYPNWWEQSPGVTPPPPDFNSSIHHCVVTIAGRPGQENRHTHTHTRTHARAHTHTRIRAPTQTKLPEHMRSFANQLYMQFMRFKQAYTHKHNYFLYTSILPYDYGPRRRVRSPSSVLFHYFIHERNV